MTNTTPSIVSDVSAMFVETTTFRPIAPFGRFGGAGSKILCCRFGGSVEYRGIHFISPTSGPRLSTSRCILLQASSISYAFYITKNLLLFWANTSQCGAATPLKCGEIFNNCKPRQFPNHNQQELSSSWDGRPWPQQTSAEKRGGAAVPLSQGSRSQCGLGWGLLPYQVASSSIQPFGYNRHVPKIGRLCPLLGEGVLGPHLTQCCLGWDLPPYWVASWSIQTFGQNRHGPKTGGSAPLGDGELGLHLTQCRLSSGLSPTKWHLDPSSHLATTDMGQKLGAPPSFLLGEGELGPHLTQCGQGWGLTACQVSSWSIQLFGHNTPTSQTERQTDRIDR